MFNKQLENLYIGNIGTNTRYYEFGYFKCVPTLERILESHAEIWIIIIHGLKAMGGGSALE